MEKLKFYFNDDTSFIMTDGIEEKYIINSAITALTHNISISILHKEDAISFILKTLYVNNVRGKIVTKVERYSSSDNLIDSVEGASLQVYWNLGGDVVAGEQVYNEVIDIGVS